MDRKHRIASDFPFEVSAFLGADGQPVVEIDTGDVAGFHDTDGEPYLRVYVNDQRCCEYTGPQPWQGRPPARKRYLVIGYDDDQHRAWFERVAAADEDEACAVVGERRPHLTAVCSALTAEELRELADDLEQEARPSRPDERI